MDSTHKLLFNGWALTALNAESVISSTGGKSSTIYSSSTFFNSQIVEHHFWRTFVPLLHAVSRSEATPTYKALLDVLVRVSENTGYPRISIASVQMDHSRAIRNAVRQHSEYTVIIANSAFAEK